MTIKKNIYANYLGQGWSALIGLAFIPIYIHYLGMEAYGLIGVFAVLHSGLALLDMGLAPSLNREMARFSAGAHSPQSIRDLLRTLETISVLLAFSITILVWVFAPWLAENWLKAEKLSPGVVADAVAVMGVVVVLRLWEGLYKGALQGLQRMVWLNTASAALATLRWMGAAAMLAFVSPSVEAFFLWQGGVSLLATGVFSLKLYKILPLSELNGRFRTQSLFVTWRFSGGLVATTLLGLLLTQVDKVMLSRLLMLETFGYYTLAATVGGSLFQFIYPLSNAMYPRFTELVTLGDQSALAETYHRSCQLMSVIIIPPALMLAFFAEPLLGLWMKNSKVVAEAAPIVVPIVLGTLCNGFMHMPYMLQLAHGWTGLAIRVNIVAVIVIVPAITWATYKYGAVGAAYTWFALNAGYVLIAIHFMHRRLLPKEKWHWYAQDIGIPLIGAASVGGIARWFSPIGWSSWSQICWLMAVGSVLLLAAVMSANRLRGEAWKPLAYWTSSKLR
jgi:O-antigen/teichoic acid export membrane protein